MPHQHRLAAGSEDISVSAVRPHDAEALADHDALEKRPAEGVVPPQREVALAALRQLLAAAVHGVKPLEDHLGQSRGDNRHHALCDQITRHGVVLWESLPGDEVLRRGLPQ